MPLTPVRSLILTLEYIDIDRGRLRNSWAEDGYLYLCEEDNKLISIWDITDPTSPSRDTTFDLTVLHADVRPNNIIKRGNYLYISLFTGAQASSGIAILDVTNPAAPSLKGSLMNQAALIGAHGLFLDTAGTYLYVAAYNAATVGIVDVSDPANPSLEGSVANANILDGIHDIWVEGNYCYGSSHFSGGSATPGYVSIIDVSNKAAPSIVSSVLHSSNGQLIGIVKRGNTVIVGSSSEGITSYDVSNPLAAPVRIGSLGGVGYWLSLAGQFLYLADGSYWVYVVDVYDPAAMRRMDEWLTPYTKDAGVRHCFVDGNWLYVSVDHRLMVFSLGTPRTGAASRTLTAERSLALAR